MAMKIGQNKTRNYLIIHYKLLGKWHSVDVNRHIFDVVKNKRELENSLSDILLNSKNSKEVQEIIDKLVLHDWEKNKKFKIKTNRLVNRTNTDIHYKITMYDGDFIE